MTLNKNSHYPKLDQSQFLTELGIEAYKKNIPLFTTLELTQDCNFRCGHCYNFDRTVPGREKSESRALRKDEWFDVIDQVMKEGAFYITFTGGEVFLYPGLWELVDHVNDLNGLVKLKSNGAILTEENVKKIISHKVASLEISLYGMSEETYQKFTSKSGMFKKVIEGIKLLKESQISLTLNLILNRVNVEEIQEMVEFAKSLNLPYNFSDEITKRYDDTDSSLDLNITEEQYQKLLSGPYREYFLVKHDLKNISFQCSCARNVCGISSSGDIFPCIGAPVKVGNITEDSFHKVWTEAPFFQKIRNVTNNDFKDCVKCDVAEHCNRSSGSAYTNTKDYFGCDPTSLRMAKLRKSYVSKNPA